MNINTKLIVSLILIVGLQGAFASTIIRDGKQWMQVTETSALSYNTMAGYCSTANGICTSGTNSSGQSLVGWTWADNNELISLFNSYMFETAAGPGFFLADHWPYNKSDGNSDWAPLALSEFDETSPYLTFANVVGGFTRTLVSKDGISYTSFAGISDEHNSFEFDTAQVLWSRSNLDDSNFTAGHWLYTSVNAAPPGATPDDPIVDVIKCIAPENFVCFLIPITVDPDGLGGTQPIYIDPVVAVGYDYEISESDVLFQYRPDPQQDGLLNGTVLELLISGFPARDLIVGTTFDFTSLGLTDINAFTIRGIDPALGLEPDDPTAFVTGLTFRGSGLSGLTDINVSMTPITEDTDANNGGVPTIPTPSSLVLIIVALGSLRLARGKREQMSI